MLCICSAQKERGVGESPRCWIRDRHYHHSWVAWVAGGQAVTGQARPEDKRPFFKPSGKNQCSRQPPDGGSGRLLRDGWGHLLVCKSFPFSLPETRRTVLGDPVLHPSPSPPSLSPTPPLPWGQPFILSPTRTTRFSLITPPHRPT